MVGRALAPRDHSLVPGSSEAERVRQVVTRVKEYYEDGVVEAVAAEVVVESVAEVVVESVVGTTMIRRSPRASAMRSAIVQPHPNKENASSRWHVRPKHREKLGECRTGTTRGDC